MTALIASILSIVTMGAQVFSNYQVAVRRWLSYNKYKYLNIASSPVTFVVWCALISSTTIIVLYKHRRSADARVGCLLFLSASLLCTPFVPLHHVIFPLPFLALIILEEKFGDDRYLFYPACLLISMQPVIFTARRITFMYLWMACLLSIARGRNAWMAKS